ncbi:MAG: hypothetical protein NVS1B10_06160 [Candidatus Saccharimonadales bacterium]
MGYNNSTSFIWCIGNYQGERAQSVVGLANEGIGYFIRSTTGTGKGISAEVAFRHPTDQETPENVTVADVYTSMKLDNLLAKRNALNSRQRTSADKASKDTIQRIRSVLAKEHPQLVWKTS